jgi:hypothetical protein
MRHRVRVNAADFTDDENWRGGYYELAIDLGPRSGTESENRLANALASVWADPQLDGCYVDRWRGRSDQDKVPPALTDPAEPRTLYGVAHLPSESTIVCSTTIVRETDDGRRTPHDWIALCLPTGALGRADARVGAYPFGDAERSLDWRRPIDDWLFGVARTVFNAAPFRVGLIGFEVSGDPAADNIDGEPPDERPIGYILAVDGAPKLHPPTR